MLFVQWNTKNLAKEVMAKEETKSNVKVTHNQA